MFEDVQSQPTEALLQAASWFMGEYGELLLEDYTRTPIHRGKSEAVESMVTFEVVSSSEIATTLEQISSRVQSVDTSMMLLTCCLKIAVRLEEADLPVIKGIVEHYQTSTDLEVQQRACEFWLSRWLSVGSPYCWRRI